MRWIEMTVWSADSEKVTCVSRSGEQVTVWSSMLVHPLIAAIGETMMVEVDREGEPIRLAAIVWERAT